MAPPAPLVPPPMLDKSPLFLDFEKVFELKDGTPPPSLIPPPTMSPPKPHPQSAARFAIRADNKEVQAAQNNSVPQNTARNTTWAVKIIKLLWTELDTVVLMALEDTKG